MKRPRCNKTGKTMFESLNALLDSNPQTKKGEYNICGHCGSLHSKNEIDTTAYESAKKFGLFDE